MKFCEKYFDLPQWKGEGKMQGSGYSSPFPNVPIKVTLLSKV